MIEELRQHLGEAQRLIADALLIPDGPDQQARIVDLIRRRVEPGNHDLWLLASLVLMNAAVGVVEGWLDNPNVDEQIADILRASLADLPAEGLGAEPSGKTAWNIVTHVADRPVEWHEVVTPLTFVMETLTMNADPDIEAMLLLG